MDDEAVFIEKSFRDIFSADEKIVIYGLGKSTKIIVENCREYNIVGLMDRTRTGESEWGIPILTLDEVAELGVKKIIILATFANVPIIYRRIQEQCAALNIDVYDINGDKKEPLTGEYVMDSFYWTCTIDAIKKKIDVADVVSFDIFDTLLVRKVLLPTDIFELVELKYKGILPNGLEFSRIRINCERRLYGSTNPTIYEIYEEIKKETGLADELIDELRETEIAEEKNSLFARDSMKAVVRYAHSKGKTVCCTSDMYLTKEILEDILINSGYDIFDSIFVSCNYGVSKNSGLYDVVKNTYSDKKILHIGDNYDVDIVGAKRFGIDDVFQIASIYRMASDSIMNKMLSHDTFLENKCELGKLFSALFNNPFMFSATNGKCVVSDNFNLGYYFIEPMIASFISWLIEKCSEENIDTVLLGARDGLIIRDAFDIRKKYIEEDVTYKYFYASRYACTLAGLNTEEDVKYAFKMAFDGSVEELLKKRFELEDNDLLAREEEESSEDYLNRHIPLILNKTQSYRRKYRQYFSREGIGAGKIGFFDFVSSGTCQLWLENIYPEAKWIGYYFIKNLDIYKDKLKIHSFFDPKCVYEKQSRLYKNYIFMENIMTSFEPTLHGFSSEGNQIFEPELRNEEQLERLAEVHKGILAAYGNRISGQNFVASRELADDILDLLNGEYSIMNASFFDGNVLEDSFCNRSFDLKKMVDG